MERPKLKNYFEKLERLWVKEKPDFPCIFLTRYKIKRNDYGHKYEYRLWSFELLDDSEGGKYLAWVDNDGYEYADYNECIADGYLVLELLPTKEEVKYGVRYE